MFPQAFHSDEHVELYSQKQFQTRDVFIFPQTSKKLNRMTKYICSGTVKQQRNFWMA